MVHMKLDSIRPITGLILKELAIAALLLLGVSFVIFVILYLSPGDPFSAMLRDQTAAAQAGSAVGKGLGGQTPWYIQYLEWLKNIVRGNLGASLRTGMPVLNEVIRVGINTLYLTLGSLFIT